MREGDGKFPGFWKMNPAVHKERRVSFTEFLQKELNDPRIFVYYHSETQRWVVAVHTTKDGVRGMWELCLLNEDREGAKPQITVEQVAYVKRRWFAPDSPRESSNVLKSEERNYFHRRDDTEREMMRMDQFLTRQLNPVSQDSYFFSSRAKRNARLYA